MVYQMIMANSIIAAPWAESLYKFHWRLHVLNPNLTNIAKIILSIILAKTEQPYMSLYGGKKDQKCLWGFRG